LFDFIIAHGDEDGVCAAAILERYSPGARILISGPRELLRVLSSIRENSSIAIVDVAIPFNFVPLQKLANKYDVYYIDHHPLPISLRETELGFRKISRDLATCASEIAYREFGEESSSPLAIYGAIGDYLDDTPLIKKLIEAQDRRTIYYEAAIIGYALSEKHEPGFSSRLAHLLADKVRPGYVRGLEELASVGLRHEYEIMDFVKSHGRSFKSMAYVENPPIIGYAGKAAFYVMSYFGKSVGVCLNKKEEYADIVLRSDGTVDVGSFARSVAAEFNCDGGGHERAASLSVPLHSVEKVLEALNKLSD